MFRDLILQKNALIYPLVGLASFLFAFGIVLVRALREPKAALEERARMPLGDD